MSATDHNRTLLGYALSAGVACACGGRLKLGEVDSEVAGAASSQAGASLQAGASSQAGVSGSAVGSSGGTNSNGGRSGIPALAPSAGRASAGGTSATQGGTTGQAGSTGNGFGGQTDVRIAMPSAGKSSTGGESGGSRLGAAGVAGTARDAFRVSAVALGFDYSCAIVDGGLRCWGSNENSKLGGDSVEPNRQSPTAVVGMASGVTKVSASGEFTCAVVDGAARCWGANAAGQLGDGTNAPKTVPVQVDRLNAGVTEIVVGGQHACAVVNGGAQCWGDNSYGQLGSGSFETSLVPVPVLGLSQRVTSIAAGPGYSCAVADGAAYCWGDNTYGQLGDGSTTTSPVAVQVFGITAGATAITAGVAHTCALVDRLARCWGHDVWANYIWGVDDLSFDSLVPVQLNDGNAGWFRGITAGEGHSCAWGELPSGGICWGPSQPGNAGFRQAWFLPEFISAGNRHDCAVAADGPLYCWGNNDHGQLGDGSTLDSSAPVKVIF